MFSKTDSPKKKENSSLREEGKYLQRFRAEPPPGAVAHEGRGLASEGVSSCPAWIPVSGEN